MKRFASVLRVGPKTR